MGLISANQIKSVANQILKDTSITIAVTYKGIWSSYSTTTRNQTETTTSVSTTALRSEYTLSEVEKSGGIIQQGDLKFTIRADALVSIAVNRKDRINDGSRDWEVIDYKPIYAGSTAIMYTFQCR